MTYYSDIVKQQLSHKSPSTLVTPMGQIVNINHQDIHQETVFMIENRGSDGSYSRSFTSKTDWQKVY